MDFVSHDLGIMMPGSPPMITGPSMYNSMGGMVGGFPNPQPNQFGTGRPF